MKRNRQLSGIILGATIVFGCAADPRAAPQAQHESASILAASSPKAGSTVSATVDTLELHFNPPARLDEVTVSGAGGTMPMLVHAVGEVADYSLPLSGVTAGTYTVSWRATAQGTEHRGSFHFIVNG